MNSENNITLQFYQNLGKLFYAIAAVDNNVKEEEIRAVKKLVENHWLQTATKNTTTKSDAKNAILDTFNKFCSYKEYQPEACYDSFINFKKENESIFTDAINSLILKTTREIATSFSGQNKSELIMLAKLDIELKK